MILPDLAIFHTVEFLGFYLPPAALWAACALVPFLLLRWLLRRIGLYALVWNPSLFNIALYVLVMGGLVYFGNIYLGSIAWL